jgi:hypothetical protein
VKGRLIEDEAKINAFVGSNSEYYRERWRRFSGPFGSIASFNMAACVGQSIWFVYRKLYIPLLLMLAAFALHIALAFYLEENRLLTPVASIVFNTVLAVLYYAVPGFYGNYWYWRKFQKVSQAAESRRHDPAEQLAYIRARGGTNALAVVLLVVFFTAPVLWAVYRANLTGYVFDATGPLTLAEIEANFLSRMDRELSDAERECVTREIEERAEAVGAPEMLDTAAVESMQDDAWGDLGQSIRGTALDPLFGGDWDDLDPFEKRIVVAQMITTKALIVCDQPRANAG